MQQPAGSARLIAKTGLAPSTPPPVAVASLATVASLPLLTSRLALSLSRLALRLNSPLFLPTRLPHTHRADTHSSIRFLVVASRLVPPSSSNAQPQPRAS